MSRVLFVSHSQGLGGAEGVLLLLLEGLDRQRFTPLLACPPGELAAAATALGVPVLPLVLPRLRRSGRAAADWLGGARALARLAQQHRADALYANTVRATCYAAPAATLARRPLLWHVQDFWLSESQPRQRWLDTLAKRLIGAGAAAAVAASAAVAAQLPLPSTIVHNAIAVERFDPALDGRPFRAAHGIAADAPLAGVVGRLRPWKGQERFVRSAALLARALPDARFVIVGGDPFAVGDGYEARLRSLVAQLGLAERVVFTGQMADVRPALAALDLFVHPGDPEPFGLVTVEAMAMRLPVVAFAHGALPEIVAGGESGLLVTPGDETALAAAMIALLGNAEARQRMGLAGRARAIECFGAATFVQGMEQVLQQITRD